MIQSHKDKIRALSTNLVVHFEQVADDNNSDRPEIDRHDPRQLLLESLKPDTIAKGHSLQSIESLGNGQHKLLFNNDVTETADLIIGTDGAWSRVRSLLSNAIGAWGNPESDSSFWLDFIQLQIDLDRFKI